MIEGEGRTFVGVELLCVCEGGGERTFGAGVGKYLGGGTKCKVSISPIFLGFFRSVPPPPPQKERCPHPPPNKTKQKKRVVLLPTSGEMFTGAMAVAKARAARFYCGNAKSCIFVVIANVRFSLACLI